MMPHMVLSGLGESTTADVRKVASALPTKGGAQIAAATANKFLVRSQLLQREADGHLSTLVTLAGKPPTPATAKQAAAAHDAYVAAATASGRLAIAGNYLGQAAVMRANAANAGLNERVLNGDPSLQGAKAAAAAAAAAVSTPVAVPVGPPAGTIPAGPRPFAPVAVPFTTRPFVAPPGTQAQVAGRAQGIGTAIPNFAPYKSGGHLPAQNMPPMIGRQMPTAPNPRFYTQSRIGAPLATVAAFRGGGLGGLGFDPVAAAQSAYQTASNAYSQAQNAANSAASAVSSTGSSGPVNASQAGKVAQNYAAQQGFNAGIKQVAFRNGAWVVILQRDGDGARGSAVVDENTGVVKAHAWPVLPSDPGYGQMLNVPGVPVHDASRNTMATPSSGGSPTASSSPGFSIPGQNTAAPGVPMHTGTSRGVTGWWKGLSPIGKIGTAAGAGILAVLGIKLAI